MIATNVDIEAWSSKSANGSKIQFGFGTAEMTEEGPAVLACFKITDRHQKVVAEFGLSLEAFGTLLGLIEHARNAAQEHTQ